MIKIANMQVYAVPGKFIMGNLRNSIHSLFYSSPDNNFDMKFEEYEDVIICQGTLDHSDRCRVLGILPIKRVGAEYFISYMKTSHLRNVETGRELIRYLVQEYKDKTIYYTCDTEKKYMESELEGVGFQYEKQTNDDRACVEMVFKPIE